MLHELLERPGSPRCRSRHPGCCAGARPKSICGPRTTTSEMICRPPTPRQHSPRTDRRSSSCSNGGCPRCPPLRRGWRAGRYRMPPPSGKGYKYELGLTHRVYSVPCLNLQPAACRCGGLALMTTLPCMQTVRNKLRLTPNLGDIQKEYFSQMWEFSGLCLCCKIAFFEDEGALVFFWSRLLS